MSTKIKKVFNKDGFTLIANQVEVLTVYRLPLESETQKELIMQNGKRAMQEAKLLEAGASNFLAAQNLFNSLTQK